MIIIKKEGKEEIILRDLNEETTRLFSTLNRIETYTVNFEKEVVEVKISNNTPFIREFDDYNEILNECIVDTILNYKRHKKLNIKIYKFTKEGTNLSFIDEIEFVGLMYIEKIKIIDNAKMKTMIVGRYKTTDYGDSSIINDFNKIKNIFSNFPDDEINFPIIDIFNDDCDYSQNDNDNFTWWIHNDPTFEPSQSFPIPPITSELLGYFDKDKHTIFICKNNILKFAQKVKIHEDWYINNINIFEKMIVLHEIGHSVFQYTIELEKNRPILDETRANYYASTKLKGAFDEYIEFITKYQPFIYKFPFLSFSHELFKKYRRNYFSKREYFCMEKKTVIKKYHEYLYNGYYKTVGVLYGLNYIKW